MLISCWSAKGGVGTTVVATALALVIARSSPAGVLLADLAGDVPTVLGLADPEEPGLTDWLCAGAAVPTDALSRLAVHVGPGVALLPRGSAQPASSPERGRVLAGLLAEDARPVVVDCGRLDATDGGAAVAVAAASTHSLLVTRACFLALRRAAAAPVRPSGVVLLTESGRALGRTDVENVVGAPVRAEIAIDPAVARAVDAGILSARLPRGFERALRNAA